MLSQDSYFGIPEKQVKKNTLQDAHGQIRGLTRSQHDDSVFMQCKISV